MVEPEDGSERIVPLAQARALVEERRRRGGRKPKYDWDRWLDGRARRLYAGRNFDCKPDSFATMFWRECRKRGLVSKTWVDHENEMVVAWAEDPRSGPRVDPWGDPSPEPTERYRSDPDAEVMAVLDQIGGDDDGYVDAAGPWID